MNNLKIAYIIPRFHPFKGGAEQNIEAIAVRMAKSGADVTVITTDVKFRDEKLLKEEFYKGVKIVRVHALNKHLNLGFYPGLFSYLLRNNFDIIHASGFGFIWVEFCLIIRKIFKKNTKYINTPHGPFMAGTSNVGLRGFMKSVYNRLGKIYLPWIYNELVAVVPKQKEWMKDLYGFSEYDITVVPNGIDPEYLEENILMEEKGENEKVIITYLNRMEWYKGIQDVIAAIAIIKKRDLTLPKFEFWIMGRAAKFTEVLKNMIAKNKLEDSIKFIYSPSDEDRDKAYLQSQINILPSKWEATGIVLIEAMAKGNVLITTNENQGREILIKEGESGFSYDFGDVEKLSGILLKLLRNYELRKKIIEHNVVFAKNFTWDAVFPEYEKMVNRLNDKDL